MASNISSAHPAATPPPDVKKLQELDHGARVKYKRSKCRGQTKEWEFGVLVSEAEETWVIMKKNNDGKDKKVCLGKRGHRNNNVKVRCKHCFEGCFAKRSRTKAWAKCPVLATRGGCLDMN